MSTNQDIPDLRLSAAAGSHNALVSPRTQSAAYPPSSWHTRCSSRINSQINPTFNVLGLDKDKHHPLNYSNIHNALEKTYSILLSIRNEIEKPKAIPSTVPFIREATKFYFQNEKKMDSDFKR